LHAYQAQIHSGLKSMAQAKLHATEELKYAQKALDEGEALKKNAGSSDPGVVAGLKFYLSNPPTEEQVLKWYRANALSILAAVAESERPGQNDKQTREAYDAVKEVSGWFPEDMIDPDMEWVLTRGGA
jgi:hypothetical protein